MRSYAEIDGPAAADVETYFSRRRTPTPRRASNCSDWLSSRLCHRFARRQELYERYYSPDPVRLSGTLYGLYDKDTHIDRSFAMLDDLDARESAGRKSL